MAELLRYALAAVVALDFLESSARMVTQLGECYALEPPRGSSSKHFADGPFIMTVTDMPPVERTNAGDAQGLMPGAAKDVGHPSNP